MAYLHFNRKPLFLSFWKIFLFNVDDDYFLWNIHFPSLYTVDQDDNKLTYVIASYMAICKIFHYFIIVVLWNPRVRAELIKFYLELNYFRLIKTYSFS